MLSPPRLSITSAPEGFWQVIPFASALILGNILGEDDAGRDEVVIFDKYGSVRMLRDNRRKFVFRLGDWTNKLYGMNADPDETTNLIDSPEHPELIQTLPLKLKKWFRTYVNSAMNASKQNIFGRGQIGRIDGEHHKDPNFSDDWFYQSSNKRDSGPNL